MTLQSPDFFVLPEKKLKSAAVTKLQRYDHFASLSIVLPSLFLRLEWIMLTGNLAGIYPFWYLARQISRNFLTSVDSVQILDQ